MTNAGMFEDAETIKYLAERIEYLEEQNKFLKKKLKESINSKVIDTLETDIGIKDWHIQKLKDEIKDLKDALEKTE
jgi:predicted  nucleic acid-binding Zn-ribbon protein